MVPIKAIIFDCDGTLVNSELLHYAAWKYALKRQGFELTESFYIQKFIGFCDIALSKMTPQILGYDCAQTVLQDKDEFYRRQLDGVSPIQSTTNFLHHLIHEKARSGLKLGVASAAKKEEIFQNLTNLRVLNSFDAIVSGVDDLMEYHDPEGTNKPKPYIYQKAAKLLGAEPSQCIAIEDSLSGISAALAAGCIAIAVPNQFTKHQDLSIAHCKIESLSGFDYPKLLKHMKLV